MQESNIERCLENCFQEAIKKAQGDRTPGEVDRGEIKEIGDLLSRAMLESVINVWQKMLEESVNEEELRRVCDPFVNRFKEKFQSGYNKQVTSENVSNAIKLFEQEFVSEFFKIFVQVNRNLESLKKEFHRQHQGVIDRLLSFFR